MKDLFSRYRSIISYLFFGVCTTVINIAIYCICVRMIGLSTVTSTIIAWIFAVIFAYITNKRFVFESHSWDKKNLVREAVSFFVCRAGTEVLDIAIMYVGVDRLGIFDVSVKVFSNILVIVLNYVASKALIFVSRSR